MITYLVTGGLGFIGSHYIDSIIEDKKNFVINLDKQTYSSNIDRFLFNKNYKFVLGDICDEELVESIFKKYDIDYVLNFAAESHVDNSYNNFYTFVKTNVLGTANLLSKSQKYWKNKKNKRFIQISTDEVYGPNKQDNEFFETDEVNPTSPYATTKASAEMLVKNFVFNFDFPAIITRSSNNFGSYQHKEKLIPKTFLSCYQKSKISLYKNSRLHKRNWLYVKDNVNAINLVLKNGNVGEIYNICSDDEFTNLDMIEKIINYCNENIDENISNKLIKLENSRPLDDERYKINSDKIKKLGFKQTDFEKNFKHTLNFYKNNIDNLVNRK